MSFACLTWCLVGLSIAKHVWFGMWLLTCFCSSEEEEMEAVHPKRKGCKVKVTKKCRRVASREESPNDYFPFVLFGE